MRLDNKTRWWIMIGALRLNGMAAAVTVDAATDTDVFGAFVRDALVPALHPGDVVFARWAGAAQGAADAAPDRAGTSAADHAAAIFAGSVTDRPSWSKVKGHVRAVAPRTVEALGNAAAEGFGTVTAADARGGFKKCGYWVH